MTLTGIAEDMRTILDGSEAHYVVRKLSGGLVLVLHKLDDRYRLACGRKTSAPSAEEVLVVAAAFAVPEGTEVQHAKRNGYHVAEMSWRELRLQEA